MQVHSHKKRTAKNDWYGIPHLMAWARLLMTQAARALVLHQTQVLMLVIITNYIACWLSYLVIGFHI